jgi:hypothetical protein
MASKSRVTRWVAAPLHLCLSALVAAAVFAVVYFVWYPGALFGAAGGRDLFLLVACVDVTIGPLITLIIFVPGKKGLKFDLAVIAVLQLGALSYGAYVLYESRPAWIVFVKDRYELVRANQVLEAERRKAKPPYDELPLTGPRLVGARMPTDPDEQLRIALTAAQGQDVQTYPQYLIPYDDVRGQARAKAKRLADLAALNPKSALVIDRMPAKLGLPADQLGFLPLRAGRVDLTVVIDRRSGDVLGTYALRPWKYQ